MSVSIFEIPDKVNINDLYLSCSIYQQQQQVKTSKKLEKIEKRILLKRKKNLIRKQNIQNSKKKLSDLKKMFINRQI